MSSGISISTHGQGERRIICRCNEKFLSREIKSWRRRTVGMIYSTPQWKVSDALAYAGYTPTNSNANSTFLPKRLNT
jgi:hypothetical protein